MIITFLRSSSAGRYKSCPFSYALEYLLGIPSESNKKAHKGNVTHKVMEACALWNLAKQKGEKEYELPEIGKFKTNKVPDINKLSKLAYDHYKSQAEYCDWNEDDLQECINWSNAILEWDNGYHSPLKSKIFGVEQFFDITIYKSWAQYSYKDPNGGPDIEGYFGIKGNIDFILDRGESHLTLIDWKTGARKDWNTNPVKYKEYKDLVDDDQLLLYSYAFHQLYPWATFDQTIFYVNDGGPVTIPRGEEDFAKAELMLRKYFEKIKNDKMPKKNVTFKCKRMCYFGMNEYKDTGETICDHIHGSMMENGLHHIMKEFGKPQQWEKYGSGGGKTATQGV